MKKIVMIIAALTLLVLGSILVTAYLNPEVERASQESSTQEENVISQASAPVKTCGCASSACDGSGSCGGSCGVKSCACGK